MSWLTKEQVWQKLSGFRADHQKNYLGFYSSRLEGFSQDPASMLIPLDDHMVHRGDGIFEAFRVSGGALIDLNAHLSRLRLSAKAVEMELRWSDEEIRRLCLELVRLSGESEGLMRLFVSRGEGSFTVNPKDSLRSELYIVMTKYKVPDEKLYQEGATVVSSRWAWKDSAFAQIKSCNYLLNVFLKQEANAAGTHFAVAFDSDGHLTESSTENVLLIDKAGVILVPEWKNILKGTTLLWVMDLARQHGFKVEQRRLTRELIYDCAEAAIVGTTWGVLPIRQWDDVVFNTSTNSVLHPVCQKLRSLLSAAIKTDSSRRVG